MYPIGAPITVVLFKSDHARIALPSRIRVPHSSQALIEWRATSRDPNTNNSHPACHRNAVTLLCSTCLSEMLLSASVLLSRREHQHKEQIELGIENGLQIFRLSF